MRFILIALFTYFLVTTWGKNEDTAIADDKDKVVAAEADMRIEGRRLS